MPATFKFYIRDDRPDKRGECLINLRITCNRKLKRYNTGIRIPPKDWHPDDELVRRSHRTYKKLNEELEVIREKAKSAYRELNREGKASAEAIQKRMDSVSTDDFFQLSGEYLKALEYNNQYHVKKQAKSAFDKLKDFHGSDTLPLNQVDIEYLNKFQLYLKNERQNKATTIHKNFAAIQAVMDRAFHNHLISENPIRNARFKLVKKNGNASKTKLPFYQIRQIEALDLKKGSVIWHSRNAFILAFYFCGMRFGDLTELRWNNLKNGILKYTMGKTGNEVNIPIREGALNILYQYIENPGRYLKLEKRSLNTGKVLKPTNTVYNFKIHVLESHLRKKKDEYVFPFLSDLTKDQQKSVPIVRKRIGSWNAYVNKCLKDVARLAGIDEDVSMHVARHSFAQYGVNERGIDAYKMMLLLGHSSIKITMDYLKSLDVQTVHDTVIEIF